MFTLRFLDTLPTSVVDELQSLISQLRGFLSVSLNEDGSIIGSNPLLNVVPVGLVDSWMTSTPPLGWLLLDGSQKNRVTYKELFELWGAAGVIGPGDGSTTFTLPDFRGRFFLGKSAAGTGSILGETGGTIDHTHTMGSHTHSIPAHTHTISSDGAHTHTFTTSSNGSHSHTGSTGVPSSGVAIAHTTTPILADTNGGGSTTSVSGFLAGNVIDDGVQTHPISADGSHTHTGTTDSSGAHAHGGITGSTSGTTGSASAGTSGSANPPYITGHWIVFSGV